MVRGAGLDIDGVLDNAYLQESEEVLQEELREEESGEAGEGEHVDSWPDSHLVRTFRDEVIHESKQP